MSCYIRISVRSYAAMVLFCAMALQAQIPSVPTLPNSAIWTNLFSSVTLSWNTAAGASSYTVQVSSDYYFSTTIFSQAGITDTALILPSPDTAIINHDILTNGYCYWRVNAANTYDVSGWSGVGSITDQICGGWVSGTAPASAATNVQLPVIFSWDDNVSELCGGEDFPTILQVATDTGFSSLVINTGGLNSSSSYGQTGHLLVYVYSDSAVNLKKGTTYYWRIRNVGGPWLDTSQFTTGGTSVLPVDNKHLKPDFIVSNKIISYSLSAPGQVEITFSDVLGRIALVVNRKQSVGRYSIELKNCNLASGHYIVSFKAAGVEKQASVVITR